MNPIHISYMVNDEHKSIRAYAEENENEINQPGFHIH